MCHFEKPLFYSTLGAHTMPNTIPPKPLQYNKLHIDHGLPDNVPGNSYVVKASGFATAGHPEDLRIVLGLAPEAKQYKVGLTKRKVLGAGTPIIENILIQQ